MSAEMSAVCWNMKGEWKVRTLKTIFFFSPFSPALRMRSAAVSSCVFGASAVKMQQKERLAALVSTRLTAAPTSAVLSIKVQYSAQSSEGCLMNLYVLLENGSVWVYCFVCVCVQPCSSLSARPSPLSVSAALVPPTTWWSFCPGTSRTRDPGNIAPVQEISTVSTLGEWGVFYCTECLTSCIWCRVTDSAHINPRYKALHACFLTGEGQCALKGRIQVKRTWQTLYTQRLTI